MTKELWIALAVAVVVAIWAFPGGGVTAETAVKLPPPAQDLQAPPQAAQETVVFAGGCFWGVQAVFQHTRGVVNAVSGYSGGSQETATYQSIGSGRTGHAEAVQVTYDPKLVSYGKLLQIYFSVAHDPTQLNRKQVAERYIAQLDAAKVFPKKIVTELTPLSAFYPAEDYHQDYATRHPNQPYIAMFDRPKIANLKALMPEAFRETPVLVSSQPG
ncbi:MAG: peptide-methionine (S)-S-oxide reductase [Comamonadaceae bacterium]|nr:MAG: peptide-methionine (S)-S-oxide reductase [Comamonadaceae bacterium]